MAGLSSKGLQIKRLDKVIEDRIVSARSQFGNDAGTTVNDVLGRLLRVHAGSEADLWELAEAVYNSFNPSYAQGVALDRIVAYAGLTRYQAAPSTATLYLTGDFLATIPASSVVASSATSHRFLTDDAVFFNTMNVSGFSFQPITVAAAEYKVTIGLDVYTYDGQVGDTLGSIAQAFTDRLNLSQNYTAELEGESIVRVYFKDPFVPRDVGVSTNLTFRKISKLVRSSSEDAGAIGQPANTLDIIGTPVLGWDTVTNPVEATEGRLRETDEQLRLRFRDTKELNARGTIEAVYSNLVSLRGVTDVQVYENPTSFVDANSLPPKSFSVVIEGGNSQEIAKTLWQVKPAGIESFGNTSVEIKDSQGLPHSIHFSRPQFVDVHVHLTISPEENGVVAADTDIQIADALVRYFADTYSVGNDVTYSRLYLPIQSIPGFQVDTLLIGTSPDSLGTSNIAVGFDQIADIKPQNVVVTVNN